MNLKCVMLCGAALCTAASFSQTVPEAPKEKINLALDGMIGLSYGKEVFGINVGGPSLKLTLGQFKLGFGAFPSLIIMDEKALPRLAVSPIIEYKKWMLIAPYYGYNAEDQILWTFGLGYKFR